MIDIALVSLLRLHAGAGQRVNPSSETFQIADELPRVVYTLIDVQRDYTDDGSTGLATGRYQLDIFASTVTAARNVADAIRIGMDGYTGTIDGTAILRVWFDSERFGQELRDEKSKKTIARYVLDVFVAYREAN